MPGAAPPLPEPSGQPGLAGAPEGALGRRSVGDVLGALAELGKPSITRLVLLTTGLGVVAAPGPFGWADLLWALAGTALVVAGANALNMFLERDSDAFMKRTRGRPLPTGRLTAEEALLFGVSASVVGLLLLAQFASMAAVALATVALLAYVMVYTPLKRLSWLALVAGAVPGALPPAIGYAALTGTVDGLGLWLFLVLFVWQMPHFLAISIFRREEYARAGLVVLPNVAGLAATRVVLFGLALVLLAVSFVPAPLGLVSRVYAPIALVSGGLFALAAARGLFPGAGDRWARGLFFASMPHLVVVLAALALTAH